MPRGMINAPVFSPPMGMGAPMQMPMMPPMPGGMPPMPSSPQGPPQPPLQQQPNLGFASPGPVQAQVGLPVGQPGFGQPGFPVGQAGPAQPGFPMQPVSPISQFGSPLPGFPGATGQIPYMNPYAAQKATNNPAWQAAATQAIQAAAAQALQEAIQSNQVPPEVAKGAPGLEPAPTFKAPTPIAGRSANRSFSTLGAGTQYSTRS